MCLITNSRAVRKAIRASQSQLLLHLRGGKLVLVVVKLNSRFYGQTLSQRNQSLSYSGTTSGPFLKATLASPISFSFSQSILLLQNKPFLSSSKTRESLGFRSSLFLWTTTQNSKKKKSKIIINLCLFFIYLCIMFSIYSFVFCS